MINTLIGLMGAYAFQGFNLILTYLECYICIALFARKLGRRDFFPVRVVMTLLDGCAVCFLLAHRGAFPAGAGAVLFHNLRAEFYCSAVLLEG